MSTINQPSGQSLSIMPPPTFVPKGDDPELFWPATAAQARENKPRANRGFMMADEALGESTYSYPIPDVSIDYFRPSKGLAGQ